MAFTRYFWTAATIGLLAVPAAAQPAWDQLGSREVNDRVDRDAIAAYGRQTYSEVRLCVERAPVRFYDVVVRFRNGQSQQLPVRELVGRGHCSEPLDLRGRERNIAQVAFTYEAASLGRRSARVRLLAR